MGKNKDKPSNKPKGSAIRIFSRLFREYAMRHWFRLFLGILSGLIMGGAMHASLNFMDFGLSSLNSSLSQKHDDHAAEKAGIAEKLKDNSTISSILKALRIDLSKNADKVIEEQNANKSAPHDKENDKASGLFRKINEISSIFGFNVSKDEAISFPLVCVLIAIMLLFFGLKSFGEFTNKYFLRWIGARIVADLRSDLFANFQRQSLAFFAKHDVGQIISKCTNDASYIEHSFSNSIAEMLLSPLQIIVAVTFLIQKAISCGLSKPTGILIIAVPIFMVPIIVISKIIRKYQHRVLDKISVLVGRMQENLSGIRVVKAYNTEEYENERFNRENQKYFNAVAKAILADIFMSPVMHITAIGIGAGFIILCFHYQISLATLAVMGYAASQAYKPIKELARMNANLQKCAAAAERIFAALDIKELIPESPNPIHVETLKDKICFNHITFSYEDNATPVIKDFSLEIGRGQFVAVVGSTGSGKSTLANLLARFYDPQEGSVTIDGVNIRDISNKDLRSIIGIVSQDNFLFNETVEFNIGYSRPNSTHEEIVAAAKRAYAHDFIMESPEGYNRPSGERGCLLSGGQKQRIAIARAILKNPPVLILDEATSALDTKTEQQVQKALNELMQSRTVFAIAHRLSTVVNADKIILLDNGCIAEQGTHKELYNLNGKYRQLYDLQLPKQ